jgi:hypothetical protein
MFDEHPMPTLSRSSETARKQVNAQMKKQSVWKDVGTIRPKSKSEVLCSKYHFHLAHTVCLCFGQSIVYYFDWRRDRLFLHQIMNILGSRSLRWRLVGL